MRASPPRPAGRLRALGLALPRLLDLQLNNCGELAALALACPALQRLALQGCRALGEAALLALAAACPSLKELDLQYCPVRGAGWGPCGWEHLRAGGWSAAWGCQQRVTGLGGLAVQRRSSASLLTPPPLPPPAAPATHPQQATPELVAALHAACPSLQAVLVTPPRAAAP